MINQPHLIKLKIQNNLIEYIYSVLDYFTIFKYASTYGP